MSLCQLCPWTSQVSRELVGRQARLPAPAFSQTYPHRPGQQCSEQCIQEIECGKACVKGHAQ
ncbi:hypothetical protein F751_6985 [Auxenochlorella protothecoides]|uniref:Uncharacterized protein n=1 Tax=Auxenochlorella protothecoides TaxID=3075 RepID=A0A087SR64_AUXPR|nr:hypothetical protein F751_6985 [Auxenochlorella protothecoides]KFM28218.1 hypothetical protein F751_6985 [Auxenochlorella protothecoides]